MLNLNTILASANNRFVTVTFKKKDGTIRTINGRFGVTKHLKGGVRTVPDHYLVIYSIADKGYRAIDPARVINCSVDHLSIYTATVQ